MGTVAVAVGCPHRLRQPIGPRTAQPCQVCASYGPPGWPRLAWAMTVDYGPRLSRAATKGVVRTPPPPPKRSKVPSAIAQMQRALAEVKPPDLSGLHAAAARMEADVQRLASKVVVEMGALRVNMIEQTERDRTANVVRMQMEQSIRLRSRP